MDLMSVVAVVLLAWWATGAVALGWQARNDEFGDAADILFSAVLIIGWPAMFILDLVGIGPGRSKRP
jgi:hypothetical protein